MLPVLRQDLSQSAEDLTTREINQGSWQNAGVDIGIMHDIIRPMASIFQLHIPNNIWLPNDAPVRPTVGIRLGQHGYAIDGSIIVGSLMSNSQEVDSTVDNLIAELERIRVKAKQELDKP